MRIRLGLALAPCVLVLASLSASAQESLCMIYPAPGSSNNGGSVGGAVYFDLTVNVSVKISDIDCNFSATTGASVGMLLYTTPDTYVGKESSVAGWTLAAQDNGTGTCAGADAPTHIYFSSPVFLLPGKYGIALVAVNASHKYTNGTGSNQNFSNSKLVAQCGAATNVPFGGSPFSPRVFNGCLYYSPGCTEEYGYGCPGSGGFVPYLSTLACPIAGYPINLDVIECLGGSTAVFLFGAARGSYLMDNGCYLNLSGLSPLVIAVPMGGSGPGNGSLTIAGLLPANSAGQTLRIQVFVLDAGASGGFANTNGLELPVK
ncbi:MAG: hypothetical protein HY812_00295 [Planctomycetes bacterium]|nr:hypothetical protein [Planctomycetota bacterium]